MTLPDRGRETRNLCHKCAYQWPFEETPLATQLTMSSHDFGNLPPPTHSQKFRAIVARVVLSVDIQAKILILKGLSDC